MLSGNSPFDAKVGITTNNVNFFDGYSLLFSCVAHFKFQLNNAFSSGTVIYYICQKIDMDKH